MNMDKNKNLWINKKAKIEILKDGKRLIYTATILDMDNSHITFIDRDNITYSFNKELIKEMHLIEVMNDGSR